MNNPIFRRVSIIILSVILIMFVGCGKEEGQKTEVSGAEPTAAQKWQGLKTAAQPFSGVTIKLLGEDLPPLHSLNKLKGNFIKKTGIAEVEVDFKNHSKVIQSILEGALSKDYKYDIIFVPHKEMGRLIATKSVFPLNKFANNQVLKDPSFDPKNQFFQPFWEEVTTYNGEWYSIPLYLGGSVVVYRKDLLESPVEQKQFAAKYEGATLGPPKNLEEWKRLAQFFHRPQSTPPLYGMTLLMSDESLWYNWQSILFTAGGNVLDSKHGWEYGIVVVNSPQAVAGTELYKWFSQYSPPDASSYSWGLGIAKQQAGVSFMTLMQYDVLAEFENPGKTKLAGKFGYFIPRRESGGCASQLESWVGLIPISAKNPEAAWLLLQWMMSKDVQISMHLEGNISPRKSTYDDAKVKELPYTETVLESLGCMTPKPTIPEADSIQDILTRQLQEYLKGSKTAKEALDEAAAQIRERLKGKIDN